MYSHSVCEYFICGSKKPKVRYLNGINSLEQGRLLILFLAQFYNAIEAENLFAKPKYTKLHMFCTNASITEINLIVQCLKFFEGLEAFKSIVHL